MVFGVNLSDDLYLKFKLDTHCASNKLIFPIFHYSNTMDLLRIQEDVLIPGNTGALERRSLAFAGTQIPIYLHIELRSNFTVRFQDNRIEIASGVLFQIFHR